MRTVRVAGRDVGAIWLGTVAFGRWGNPDHAACAQVLRAALDRGVTAIDTAELYSAGESETIVGKAIAGIRDEVFLATKFGHPHEAADALDAAAVVASCDASMARLGVDHLDLYQLHRLPRATPLEEVVAAMSRLVDSGRVRAIGGSALPAPVITEIAALAGDHGYPPFATEQAPYSILVREIERDVVAACRAAGVAVVGFAPLNGSFLTGKYRPGAPLPPGSRAAAWPMRADRFDFGRGPVAEKLRVVRELDVLAAELGVPLIELAVRFALSRDGVAATVLGARTTEQLLGALPSTTERLSSDVLERIDAIVPPRSTVDPEDVVMYRSDQARA